jgi:hypothetical protein
LRRTLLEIPGEPDEPESEFARFERQMMPLIGYKCGMSFSLQNQPLRSILTFPQSAFAPGEGTWIGTERGRQLLDSRWWTNLLPKENFMQFEHLLKQHEVDYVKNAGFFRSCCEKGFGNLESLFLFNHTGEKLLLLYSPVPLYVVEGTAYLDKMSEDDLRLERAYVEWYDEGIGADGRIAGYYTLLPSIERAEAYVDEAVKSELERSLNNKYFGCKIDVVEVHDTFTDRRYKYPPDLEISDDMNVLRGNCFMPKILRTYQDGVVALSANTSSGEPIPERYYSNKEGLTRSSLRVGACTHCLPQIEDVLRKKVVEEMEADQYHVFTCEPARKIRYVFDPTRIKFLLNTTEVPVF